MGSSDRVSTGLPGLDKIIDQLRIGDNVVWQVDSIDDYRRFVGFFVRQARKENRKIVYMRFGSHPEIVEKQPGIKVYRLDAGKGFEAFSTEAHNIAFSEGREAFYVFDCLSELLTAWATDLMIGNFFEVTCPYFFELDTVAYFAVLRGAKSYRTISRIRETTQVLLDLYRYNGCFYVHPLKVWNRYSPNMFLPHLESGEEYIPLTRSVEASRFLSYGPVDMGRKLDYWDQVFLKAQELLQEIQQKKPDAIEREQEMVEKLCRMVMGRDERLFSLACKYFSLQDLLEISNRMIGSGFIGGKTVGLLLARKILEVDCSTNWQERLEPHDSFFIGSDVFFTYLVENDCWKLRLEQKKEENYFSAAAELKQRILNGTLPDAIRDQIFQMLEYFGQYPIIVRSSSLLEDGFGNAFAGKYESVFCVNQGNLQKRYELFEAAVKKVYASTMSEDALAYRLQRGLADSEEQMALLVQRVSGSHHAHYFFPDLAGVAFSQNPYIWKKGMDAKAGMVRLVLGLGTRAVDRVEDDYPRLVALDQPLLRPVSDLENIREFSQHYVDVLDTEKNDWDTVPLSVLSEMESMLHCWELVAVRDSNPSLEIWNTRQRQTKNWVLTFDKFLADTSFVKTIREMLQVLETAYENPVDIEFTCNFCSEGNMQINLLQCRPLQTAKKISGMTKRASNVEKHPRNILFSTKDTFMGSETLQPLKIAAYVDAEKYNALTVVDKYQTARIVGQLNRKLKETNSQPFMLMGPGRWGTSTPSLGIPVSFAEICHAAVLVEVAGVQGGYMPELSFGTHFFQDLVETGIFYVALFPEKKDVVFNHELLLQAPNLLTELLPKYGNWQSVIKVIDWSAMNKQLWLESDLQSRHLNCYLDSDLVYNIS